MISLTNLRIGKKIAVVLAAAVVLLAGLSGLSIWGDRTNEGLTTTLTQRLTKARLAESLQADSAGIEVDFGKMTIAKKTDSETLNHIAELRKHRAAEMEEFIALADTPTSIKQGADMAAMIPLMAAANDRVLSLLSSGKSADAAKAYPLAYENTSRLYAKATEAANWQLGLVAKIEPVLKDTGSNIRTALIAGSLLAIAIAIFGGVLLTRNIASPISDTVAHLEKIAGGDLSQDASAELQKRQDEVGNLSRAMQKMTASLRTMIAEVVEGVTILSSSSSDLKSSSTEMTTGSLHASDKAHSVAAAAEEMSSNITSVAAGMEQTSTNLSHVASATDQMTSTIGEIAQNSEKARRITDEAMIQAARVTEQINQLGAAAHAIGQVTETINEISSQTNLLALNATIEAARAGSAGKGFAVVATEIKALAQQAAAATDDIKSRIAGVQAATTGGIAEIGKISRVITEVSTIVSSIAAAIEEQSTATRDIARNIAEASIGVNDANSRVAETSQASREIARDIVSVDVASQEMATGSNQVLVSAGKLSGVAESLRVTIARYHS